MTARVTFLVWPATALLPACQGDPTMVQRKIKPPVVTPELARSIGSTFRVSVDPHNSGPTLAEVIAEAPRIKGPPIALAPQGQLDGALAQIIRDPGPDAKYPA